MYPGISGLQGKTMMMEDFKNQINEMKSQNEEMKTENEALKKKKQVDTLTDNVNKLWLHLQ